MIVPAGYQGDFAAGATIDMKVTAWDDALGTMDDIASGAVAVYKDNSTTESTAGVTLTVTFDSKVGLANIRITTASDGTFYAAGSNYTAVLTTGTIGGTDHAGFILGSFSIANRPVQGLATGVVTAAAIAADAIGASELAADAVTEIADGILKRDMSAVTGESSRSLLNALRFLRNKWSISGSTLTVTKEDDSTAAWTAALTTSGSADPVTGSDPS